MSRFVRVLALLPLSWAAAWPFVTDSIRETGSYQRNDERALVVALDGVDNELLDRWRAAGWMPNLESLVGRSSRCELRGALDPMFPAGLEPAVTWTGIATGLDGTYNPELGDVGTPDRTGYAELPAHSALRWRPTFWEVLSHFGGEVAVVGWWNTWPSDWVNGSLVSDRFFLDQFDVGPFSSHPVPLSGGDMSPLFGRGVPHLCFPEELSGPLSERLRELPPDPLLLELRRLRDEVRPGEVIRDRLDGLAAAVERDLLVAAALEDLVTAKRHDLSTCYLSSLLTAMCWFSKYAEPEAWTRHPDPRVRQLVDPAEVERYGQLLPKLVSLLDRRIAELYRAVGSDAHLVLVSAYGSERPGPGAAIRRMDLDPLLEQLGFLVRKEDGSIDWSKTKYFDRSLQPFDLFREVQANYRGDFPSGFLPSATPQERASVWPELERALGNGVKVEPRWTHPRMTGSSDRVWVQPLTGMMQTMGLWAEQVMMSNAFPSTSKLRLPGGREMGVDEVFPVEDLHARIREVGTLWFVRPEGQGGRGIDRAPPFGDDYSYRTRVAGTILALFGLPRPALDRGFEVRSDVLPLELAERAAVELVQGNEWFDEIGRGDPTKPTGARHLALKQEMERFGYGKPIRVPLPAEATAASADDP